MIDRILEASDLRTALVVLALLGVFLSVYVMQLTHWEAEDDQDPAFVRALRRLALAVLAWALLWSLSYAWAKDWQPWPPYLAVIFATDAVLLIRAVAIKARIRREGVKPDAPRVAGPKLTARF